MKYLPFCLAVILFLSGCVKKPDVHGKYLFYGVRLSTLKRNFSGSPHLAVIVQNWTQKFPSDFCLDLLKAGTVPYIKWTPEVPNQENSLFRWENILNSEWDEYIDEWAREAKQYRYPVLISFSPEFNVESHAWSLAKNEEMVTRLHDAYSYIMTRFNKIGAANVIWIWTVNEISDPQEEWNSLFEGFPKTGISGIDLVFDQTTTKSIQERLKLINSVPTDQSVILEINPNWMSTFKKGDPIYDVVVQNNSPVKVMISIRENFENLDEYPEFKLSSDHLIPELIRKRKETP